MRPPCRPNWTSVAEGLADGGPLLAAEADADEAALAEPSGAADADAAAEPAAEPAREPFAHAASPRTARASSNPPRRRIGPSWAGPVERVNGRAASPPGSVA